MFFRTIFHLFRSRFGHRLGHFDIARTNFVTLPTDQDILRHMNNGVYLSIMDVARFDMLMRNGVWQIFKEKGWYPVVVLRDVGLLIRDLECLCEPGVLHRGRWNAC